MKTQLSEHFHDELTCPYFSQRDACFEIVQAHGLTGLELDYFLHNGWRKFGTVFFRPSCVACNDCLPLRIEVKKFLPTNDQKRNKKKNMDIEVKVLPLQYFDEAFELYEKFERIRFDHDVDKQSFISMFYLSSCPGLQVGYYLSGKLVALGFLDQGNNSLSSVYFIYDPDYLKRGLGVFGVLREIELASHLELEFYYLGYYIKSHHKMCYKGRFGPHQLLNWQSKEWQDNL